MASNYSGVIFQHNFVPVTNQPVTRSMTASSSTSICNPTPTKKTMVTNSDNSQLTLVSPYKNYVYHNAKAFRESTSITNSQIENIWDHYFDKNKRRKQGPLVSLKTSCFLMTLNFPFFV